MNSDIIFHPKVDKREKKLPANGIFFVNPSESRHALSYMRKNGGKTRFMFNSGLCVDSGELFFVAGPAVGAPMSVLVLEKLIALGAKNIIVYGWCGAASSSLRIGDLLLPHDVLSGEGTSKYYDDNLARPSSNVISILESVLAEKLLKSCTGCLWSTDAPYRESRKFLNNLNRQSKVVAVDMEFSALCTVASFRKINLAGLFIVSDELYTKEWKSGFSRKDFLEKSKTMVETLITEMAKK